MLKVTRVHPVIRGREKIDKEQSYVVISNHQSEYDILALVTTLGIQYRWIIKKELRKVPMFGYALYASRNIFIDRGDHEQAMQSIRNGLERLPRGVSVMFFAEGTRSADGSIAPFKKGGFLVALEKGLPILPVTVNGSRRILPKKSLVFTPGPIEVVVADPIDTREFSRETMQDLVDKTRKVIISHFNPSYPDT
jgi:1-acyl-sn-glycerol-3-phosphate acyltransferase